MHHRIPLPPALTPAFHIDEAAVHGIGRGRCAARDLHRPYPGIRSITAPDTLFAHARCYRPRLRAHHAYSKRTAARLLGLPLPWRWRSDEPLDVAVAGHAAPPRSAGVRGHRIAADRMMVVDIAGTAVLDAVATTFLLARELTPEQLLIMLEAVVTTAENYPELAGARPFATAADVDERLHHWGSFPGVGRIRRALEQVHVGVESPKETETRLVIMAAGLPEPIIQHVVHVHGRRIARVDLAYPELRIAIEYEGDGHRTDRDQWREDIRRQRELEEGGWLLIRITQLDLGVGRAAFLARLRRAIAMRTAV